jgi:hypothetical protein
MATKDRTMDKPPGFEAAAKDWNIALAGREMGLSDWYSLTLGEQARYGAAECKTKGAIYSVHVTHDHIAVSISLPRSLHMDGLREDEAKWIEAALHKELETTIHWILVERAAKSGRPF